MAVQGRRDITTIPLLKGGKTFVRNQIIEQNAARTTALLYGTVMAYNATTQMWVPFVGLADVEGESVPRGVYLGDDILAATLVAGDVEDIAILLGGCCRIDGQLLVWDDDTRSAVSIVNPGTIEARTAGQCLADVGIFIEDTEDISEYEN